jgi:glutaredoxin
MTYNGKMGTKAPPIGRHSFTAGMTKMLSFVTRSQHEKNNTGVEGERLQRVDNVDDSPLEETEDHHAADDEFIKVNRRNTAPTLFWNAIRRSSIFGSNNEPGKYSLTHSLTYLLTHSLTHSLTH